MTDEKRDCATFLVKFGLSVLKACNFCSISRSTFYRSRTDWRKADSDVIDAINTVLTKAPQAGFWKIYKRIRRKVVINHKRVYRVYLAMGLNKPRRVKRVLPKRIATPLEVNAEVNDQWALDFVHDSLYCGKRFRTLNVIDEGTRECIAIEVDTSLPAMRVVRVLNQLKEERGSLPRQIRLDNGPELISSALADWAEEHGVKLAFIPPGKPQKNGFVERFNGTFRREFLDAYLFESLSQVREMAWHWRLDYNDERPHESIGDLPPSVYRQLLENSSLEVSH